MNRGPAGRYEVSTTAGEAVRAFVPHPLPPHPPLDLSGPRQRTLEQAVLACGRLDGVSDLLLFELDEAPGVPFDDVVEVSNYVAALEHGMARLREGLPLSSRLLREVHGKLLAHGRGADKLPGEFRRSQNWVGGTRPGNAHFVPPPPDLVPDCMAELERFIHSDVGLPTLVKAALAHLQFETVHPFLDGNGRVGRLMIALILQEERVLRQPLLYLSLYFKQNRGEYYRQLDSVRRDGDWESWLDFFLEGVAMTAGAAVETAHRLLALFRADEQRLAASGRSAASAMRIYGALRARPVATIQDLGARAGLTFPTTAKAVDALVSSGIARELTGGRRNRVFAYDQYLKVLNEGTEPL